MNARVAHGGSIRVELLDEGGQAIPDYGREASVALAGDSTRHRVMWKGGGDPGRLRGERLRLHFVVRRAELYAYAV